MATRKKRLNKKQQLERIVSVATETIIANRELIKKDKVDEMLTEMIASLTLEFAPKKGGGASTKVNENGEVFCNYFEEYLPAEEFNTKLSKPNKTTGQRTEVYKANCKEAEAILRRIKTLKLNVIKQATEEFRAKRMGEEKYHRILDNLDKAAEAKYKNIDEIPTISDIVGLTTLMEQTE